MLGVVFTISLTVSHRICIGAKISVVYLCGIDTQNLMCISFQRSPLLPPPPPALSLPSKNIQINESYTSRLKKKSYVCSAWNLVQCTMYTLAVLICSQVNSTAHVWNICPGGSDNSHQIPSLQVEFYYYHPNVTPSPLTSYF